MVRVLLKKYLQSNSTVNSVLAHEALSANPSPVSQAINHLKLLIPQLISGDLS